MIRHLLALCLAMACSPGLANPVKWKWNAPYPELAEALRLKGDPARGQAAFDICQDCHRVDASGRPDGRYPRLAGQHVTVLVKQLADMLTGRRINPKMRDIADHRTLSLQNIADLAAYLQGLPTPPNQGQGRGNALPHGERLYVMDCASCHGPRGEGDPHRFYPRLSGQHYLYLLREGRMIRDGERLNAHPDMARAIRHYSDDDLAAVSDYISRLPVATP